MTNAEKSSGRILVMEDDGLLAMMMSEMLGRLGYEVVGPCRTVDDALARIQSEAIDVALLDVNLGNGETSYPAAELLGQRGVPFVFLTGYGEGSIDEAFKGRPIMSKPFSFALLSELLQELVPPGDAL